MQAFWNVILNIYVIGVIVVLCIGCVGSTGIFLHRVWKHVSNPPVGVDIYKNKKGNITQVNVASKETKFTNRIENP